METRTPRRGRNFHCSLCSSSFHSNCSLTRHIRSHIKEKIYGCDQCEHRTNDRSALAIHVKAIHDKSTPFHCSFPGCSYSASQRKDLPKHSRTHEIDPVVRRPFPCTVEGCVYRATRKSHLGSHVKNRHNENRVRDFVCSMCAAAFYDQTSLRAHVRVIHVKEGVLSCSQCEYKSSYPQSLRKHLRSVHGVDGGKEVRGVSQHQPSNSRSQQRKKETIQTESNVMTRESGREFEGSPQIPGAEKETKTGGLINNDSSGISGDSLRIFQCMLCHFIAKDEEEALRHSPVHGDHIILLN